MFSIQFNSIKKKITSFFYDDSCSFWPNPCLFSQNFPRIPLYHEPPPPPNPSTKNTNKSGLLIGWKEAFYLTYETDCQTCVIILGSWPFFQTIFTSKGNFKLQTKSYTDSQSSLFGKTKSISNIDRIGIGLEIWRVGGIFPFCWRDGRICLFF